MDKTNLPEGYQSVMPYLIVRNATGLLEFMKKVFGAEETYKVFRDEDQNVIMHAEVRIGDSTIMFAEATEQFQPFPAGMFVYVDDADETYREAINEGAVSLQEPADRPYGRSGGVTDSFGNTWWITSVLPSS
jgi:uncharacterized glyoxalase superfamily protein PhnB